MAGEGLHVLHVIDGIDVGGAEMVLVQLVEGLQAAGHGNTVMALTSCRQYGDRLRASGAEVVALGLKRGHLPVSGLRHLFRATRAVSPTVIQGWMYHGNLAASVARLAAPARSRVAWSIHNSIEPPPQLPRLTRAAARITRAMSSRPAAIIYVSEAAARQHERAGFDPAPGYVIPNGTDCQRFHPQAACGARLRKACGLSPEAVLVGHFARWHPMKGHTVLFDAAARLVGLGSPIHLVLAGTGSGTDNAELEDGLRVRGLLNRVSRLGERHDTEALMPGLDVLALPSLHGEAFPLVLGEAMAAGVPCVASDVGDARLIVAETGLVVPPGDVGRLAGALQSLIVAGPAARREMGERARARIEAKFSLETMVSAYAGIYDALGQSTPTPPQPLADCSPEPLRRLPPL